MPDADQIIALVEELGVPVFPIKPNQKLPATVHGHNAATMDITQIREWSAKRQTLNWAMPTGTVSGIVVLDIDIRSDQGKHGDETLRALEAANAALPETVTVITPSGGQHLWFRLPAGIKIKSGTEKLGNGLDIKAEGGYVVVPPSQIKGRSYQFEASSDPNDVRIAELPAW